MLQERDLHELTELVSTKTPILSLYLNVDLRGRSVEEHKLCLRQLLAQAMAQGAATADIERIERFFEHEYNRQGRGVACFSHQQTAFWRVYTLLIPVQDFAFVGVQPYIKPLSDVLDEYDRFGVITVDKEGARTFVYHLGALEDSAGMMGAEVKRHKQGGWGAQKLQRHEDEEAKHNLKDAAEWADGYLREHKVTRVVLSGSDGNVALFRELLSRPLQDKVIGQVSLDMNASPSEVWEGAYAVAAEAQRRTEAALLDQVVTLAHKGGAGVVGLADTLAALQQGRVYHLLVARNFHMPGRQCTHCNAVIIEAPEACPYCSHDLTPTSDAVEMAMHRAVEGGVKVSMLEPTPLLNDAGSIAAVLRY